jgi:hypothetical protein
MNRLPSAKTENIVVQNLENELLIYDLEINKAFCLNETSALVYQACDGKTDLTDFKNKHDFPDEIIFLTLDSLKKEKLLEDDFVSPLKGMKRREVIRLIGKTSLIALPVIASLIAPTAVQAAASCGGTSAPGTVLGCTALESQCLNMNQMCASCSTTATLDTAGATCASPNPFICTCN